MFDKIKSTLKSSSDDDNKISPADVATDVSDIHDTLDGFKVWSTETVEWLEGEQVRLADSGEDELVSELDDLISYVQSVFFRIEYGDHAIQQSVEEASNAADDGEPQEDQ